MARKPRFSKVKAMLPNFFVFCEGDSEVKYVEILRSYFRQPVHIIAKKTLLNITPALVERCKASYIQTKNDHTFLMYDLDVTSVLERLKKIPNTTLLCSNPCFELWLLLHAREQSSEISSDEVVKELRKSALVWKDYKKSQFTKEQLTFLQTNTDVAIDRAKKLHEFQNPSTSIYKLIEMLSSDARQSSGSRK
jgi:hypothetical protein